MQRSFSVVVAQEKTKQLFSNLIYVAGSVLVTVLSIQTNIVPYEAGTGDHHVILPAGLLRADASLYLGDYFIREAVMPHWFFEYLTTFAARFNLLNSFFFIFWLVSLGLFSIANLLTAQAVVPHKARTVAFVMLVFQVLGVRILFGTSAMVQEQALPHPFAASMTFLILALWRRGDRKILFLLLPLVPIIHIQIGAILLGLVVLLTINAGFRGQRPAALSIYSLILGVITTVFGLFFRPIAGNTEEFSDICRRLIPHHCYAPSWTETAILLSVLFVIVGVVAVLLSGSLRIESSFMPIVVGIPIFVLILSLLLDRFGTGTLVNLVRGNNIYRLAVVVLPFVYWTPMMIWNSTLKKINRVGATALSGALLATFVLLPEHGSRLNQSPTLLIWLLVVAAVAYGLRNCAIKSYFQQLLMVAILVSAVGVGIITHSQREFSWPDTQFIPNEYQRAFGQTLKQSVPEGKLLSGNPTSYWLRMDSGVGYAVDCKFRPIGGGAPLKEFYKRLTPLGGYEAACLNNSFDIVTAEDLNSFAVTSGSDLLLVTLEDARISDLKTMGWETILSPSLEVFGHTILKIGSRIS